MRQFKERIIVEHQDVTQFSKHQEDQIKSQYQYLFNMHGTNGFERVKLIKQAFKCIIDNFIPKDERFLVYYARNNKTLSLEKMKRIQDALPFEKDTLAKELQAGPLEAA